MRFSGVSVSVSLSVSVSVSVSLSVSVSVSVLTCSRVDLNDWRNHGGIIKKSLGGTVCSA